jgi:uncharacterized membrane protein
MLVYLSPLLAISSSTASSIFLQDIIPSSPGPALRLFPYNEEVVGIGLIGGVLPILASVLIMASRIRAEKKADYHRPFQSLAYWLVIVLISLLITVFFSVSQLLFGGLALPKLWALWLIIAAVTGVDYWWFRGRRWGWSTGPRRATSWGRWPFSRAT